MAAFYLEKQKDGCGTKQQKTGWKEEKRSFFLHELWKFLSEEVL